MLTAVPVAAWGGAPVFSMVGAPELVPAETPILRLYQQWTALVDEANGSEWTDEQHAAQDPERQRIEDAIRAEPATDIRDLAAKIIVLTGEGTWSLPDETTLECARIVGRDFARLPRCLFEGRA